VKRIAALVLFFVATPAMAFAGTVTAPEIDASTAVGGLTLLSGAILVIRGRRRR